MKNPKTKHLPMLTSFSRYFVNGFASFSGYFVNRRCTQTGNKKRKFVWILTSLMLIGLFGIRRFSSDNVVCKSERR